MEVPLIVWLAEDAELAVNWMPGWMSGVVNVWASVQLGAWVIPAKAGGGLLPSFSILQERPPGSVSRLTLLMSS